MDAPKNVIEVGIADDQTLLREALASLINTFPNHHILFKASNGQEVLDNIKSQLIPDVMILDLNMPVMDGFEVVRWLKMNHPEVRVLILSMFDSDLVFMRLLQLGIKAFLKKDAHPDEFIHALESVMKEDYYYCESIFGKEQPLSHALKLKQDVKPSLSEREITFLKWTISDLTYDEIAKKMCVSRPTIDNYCDSLRKKFLLKSRLEFAMYAVKSGMV